MALNTNTPSIRLVVHQLPSSSINLSLRIPLEDIQSLCHWPAKFLRFLGWAIVGIDGYLAQDPAGEIQVEDQAIMDVEQTYYYVLTSESLLDIWSLTHWCIKLTLVSISRCTYECS